MEARIFIIFLGVLSFCSSVSFGVYAFRRRASAPTALPFALLMFAAAYASMMYTIEVNMDSFEASYLLLKFEYMGDIAIPLFWFIFARLFAAAYSDQSPSPWNLRLILFVSLIPLVTAVLVWTNESHHLIYRSISLSPDSSLSILRAQHGVLFWFTTAYLYALLLGGSFLIVLGVIKSEKLLRGQGLTLILATLLPWLGHVLLLLHASPFGIDPTPFLFSISGALLIVAVRRFGMFDLMPVARQLVMNAIRDSVIVVDLEGRILDANHAAKATLPKIQEIMYEDGGFDMLARLGVPVSGEAELKMECEGSDRWFKAVVHELQRDGRLRGRVVILVDIDDSKRMLERLERLASIDELTQVSNRRRFFEHAERELAIARRSQRPVSFAMFDLDHFKQVNDSRGHAAGDKALIAVCEACHDSLRATDIVCRYGGEEFIIILPDVKPISAFQIIERARLRIAQAPILSETGVFRITASFGLTGYPGIESGSPESLEVYLRQSDQALYRAKREGRNRSILYDGEAC